MRSAQNAGANHRPPLTACQQTVSSAPAWPQPPGRNAPPEETTAQRRKRASSQARLHPRQGSM
eukprot:11210313-Lingulodinium_polyedra.AAC.1